MLALNAIDSCVLVAILCNHIIDIDSHFLTITQFKNLYLASADGETKLENELKLIISSNYPTNIQT